MNEQVVLVDKLDRSIGREEKLRVHREGLLHRAFSIFLFNSEDQLLLQRRALNKYHSGGLWSNACCGHPRPSEQTEAAAVRRLPEELGLSCPLTEAFAFVYRAQLPGGLVEHEVDHVFMGHYDGTVWPNPEEVMAHGWISLAALRQNLCRSPDSYTVWFRLALDRVIRHRTALKSVNEQKRLLTV